jgi:hypothetical protein
VGWRFGVATYALALMATACGGGDTSPGPAPDSASTAPPTTIASTTPSPLVIPKGCGPKESRLEIEARSTSWVGSTGRLLAPAEACLSAPANRRFTITLRNDPHNKDFLPSNHNLSIWEDSTVTNPLFTGDFVLPGESATYKVDPLPAGVYFFKCDIHPRSMTGVLLAE